MFLEESVCVVHNSCGDFMTQNRNRFEAMTPDQGVSVYMSRTLPCIMVFLFGTGWYVTRYVEERSLWCVGEAMNSVFGGEVLFKMTKQMREKCRNFPCLMTFSLWFQPNRLILKQLCQRL